MSQESLEEYKIRKLEETVLELKKDMTETHKVVTEIRMLVVENRVKNSLLIVGTPTILTLILTGLSIWVK